MPFSSPLNQLKIEIILPHGVALGSWILSMDGDGTHVYTRSTTGSRSVVLARLVWDPYHPKIIRLSLPCVLDANGVKLHDITIESASGSPGSQENITYAQQVADDWMSNFVTINSAPSGRMRS